MTGQAFFPYHPRGWRLRLTFAMACTVVLAAWAVAGVVATGALLEVARAGLSLGLLAALFTVWVKLRPRPDWGVTVHPLSLTVSKPLGGRTQVLLADVEEARWLDPEHRVYALRVAEGPQQRQVLLVRQLFGGKAELEAAVRAIELTRLSPPADPGASA